MSKLRKTENGSGLPLVSGGTAYFAIYNAVRNQAGLIAGQLSDGHGGYCAIGSYWRCAPRTSLRPEWVDDVAAVNDCIAGSPSKRKREVLRWLRWRLTQLNFPGFTETSLKFRRR